MGILNVTPDSFSDGGRYDTVRDRGRARAARWPPPAPTTSTSVASRPGRAPRRVAPDEERRRVLPVVAELAALGVRGQHRHDPGVRWPQAALAAGAVMVNDVSGGLADPAHGLASSPRRCSLGAHAPAGRQPRHVRRGRRTTTSVADVRRELGERVDAALAAGVAADRLVVDPGLGFAKQPEHDLALLAGLDRITDLGFPVLVGASRKRFLGALLATADGDPRPTDRRDSATLATSVLAGTRRRVGSARARRGGQRRRGARGGRCRRRTRTRTLALTAPARRTTNQLTDTQRGGDPHDEHGGARRPR